MAFRTKIIGIILILLGAMPFLLKIEAIGSFFEKYIFLNWLTPGEVIYQIVVILLGVLLLVRFRARLEATPRY